MGKVYYLSHVKDDPDGSKSYDEFVLKKHEAEHGIQIPGVSSNEDAVVVADIAENWIQGVQDLVETGERSGRTLEEYKATAQFVIDQVGKARIAETLGPDDFKEIRRRLAKRYNLVGLTKRIIQVRTMFNTALEDGLLDKPIRYGTGFEPPSAKSLRNHRGKQGPKDFGVEEIRSMLSKANSTRRAMILLGVNAGLGNSDVADLHVSNLDLSKGWLDYPRKKTEVPRRCPLWPETIEAIERSMQERPKSEKGLVFVSVNGQDYQDDERSGWRITGEFRQILKMINIADGRGFYGLRRTFQTIAEGCDDIIAVRAIMGHADPQNDMSARYRQRITDERLHRAVETVREWLLPIPPIDKEGK
jgi:integrase